MALTNVTLSELSEEFDDDYRLVLATEDARVDVQLSAGDVADVRETIAEQLDGPDGENIDSDADDPFDL